MNHYEKLAIVIFRVLGFSILLIGLFGIASTLIMAILSDDSTDASLAAFYSIYFYTYAAYGIAGLILFTLSKSLAARIARSL